MIVYLHGFNSSPQSFKAQLLKQRLTEAGRASEFMCPQLPWQFAVAGQMIESALLGLSGQTVCLVGSSLGGFYATYFAEKFKLAAVMVNPAVMVHKQFAKLLGHQRNFYTDEEYVLVPEHVEELRKLDVSQITYPERYLLLTQTGDEVLDYRQAVEKFRGCEQIIIKGGDHAFSDFEKYVDRVIAFADGRAGEGIIHHSR
jgi:predicted esterase YcpF (UPF0227 family)